MLIADRYTQVYNGAMGRGFKSKASRAQLGNMNAKKLKPDVDGDARLALHVPEPDLRLRQLKATCRHSRGQA